MTQADSQYKEIVSEIIKSEYSDEGENVRTIWADGTPAHTKSIIGKTMRFDNSEIPILTTKFVAWKTAIKELLWIWQKKSNVVQDLRNVGVNIWNEWEQSDGTIGKAYGYQLGKKNRFHIIKNNLNQNIGIRLDQVDHLLLELKNNPSSRRHITTLWNLDDLDEMSLTPCVYETQWHVKNNKLHLEVRCRSNDMALGNPFNVFQYNVLQRMIAQVTGYELGEYLFHIGDAHIYTRHIEPLKEQIERSSFEAPRLWINPEIKDFYNFTIDDFRLEDYQYGEKIKMEVAI